MKHLFLFSFLSLIVAPLLGQELHPNFYVATNGHSVSSGLYITPSKGNGLSVGVNVGSDRQIYNEPDLDDGINIVYWFTPGFHVDLGGLSGITLLPMVGARGIGDRCPDGITTTVKFTDDFRRVEQLECKRSDRHPASSKPTYKLALGVSAIFKHKSLVVGVKSAGITELIIGFQLP